MVSFVVDLGTSEKLCNLARARLRMDDEVDQDGQQLYGHTDNLEEQDRRKDFTCFEWFSFHVRVQREGLKLS